MPRLFAEKRQGRRELLLSVVLGVFAGLFLASPKLIDQLPTRSVKTYSFSTRFTGEPVESGAHPRICEAITDGGELVIRVTGRLEELRNYQNLFQTADQNAGIRIEVDETGAVGLLVADRSELTYLAVPAAGTISPGRFQALIRVSDGRNVTFQLGKSVATGHSGTLQPSCSNLVVGYGFDSSRLSSGRFRADFSAFGEQRRFIGPAIERVVVNEFFRSVALGVMVFCLILVALNITDPTARRPDTDELPGDEENGGKSNGSQSTRERPSR